MTQCHQYKCYISTCNMYTLGIDTIKISYRDRLQWCLCKYCCPNVIAWNKILISLWTVTSLLHCCVKLPLPLKAYSVAAILQYNTTDKNMPHFHSHNLHQRFKMLKYNIGVWVVGTNFSQGPASWQRTAMLLWHAYKTLVAQNKIVLFCILPKIVPSLFLIERVGCSCMQLLAQVLLEGVLLSLSEGCNWEYRFHAGVSNMHEYGK